MNRNESGNWFNFILKNNSYHFPGILSGVFVYISILALLVLSEIWLNIFEKLQIPSIFHTVLGLVLGLLLVFRTNTAYDRWWEGRKLLGDLTNSSRSLAIKMNTFLGSEFYEIKNEFMLLIISFSWTLKNHLRENEYSENENQIPQKYRERFKKALHKPNYLNYLMNERLHKIYSDGTINNEKFKFIEEDIITLTRITGGCERIKNTPIPLGYSLHLKRILLLYLVTLPFGIINSLGWWTILVGGILFYTMVGIEMLGAEIENPFGTDFNDLPFDSIDTNINKNVREIFSNSD